MQRDLESYINLTKKIKRDIITEEYMKLNEQSIAEIVNYLKNYDTLMQKLEEYNNKKAARELSLYTIARAFKHTLLLDKVLNEAIEMTLHYMVDNAADFTEMGTPVNGLIDKLVENKKNLVLRQKKLEIDRLMIEIESNMEKVKGTLEVGSSFERTDVGKLVFKWIKEVQKEIEKLKEKVSKNRRNNPLSYLCEISPEALASPVIVQALKLIIELFTINNDKERDGNMGRDVPLKNFTMNLGNIFENVLRLARYKYYEKYKNDVFAHFAGVYLTSKHSDKSGKYVDMVKNLSTTLKNLNDDINYGKLNIYHKVRIGDALADIVIRTLKVNGEYIFIVRHKYINRRNTACIDVKTDIVEDISVKYRNITIDFHVFQQ